MESFLYSKEVQKLHYRIKCLEQKIEMLKKNITMYERLNQELIDKLYSIESFWI